MRRYLIEIEGIGRKLLQGDSAEEALLVAGYDPRSIWFVVSVYDVEDGDDFMEENT